MIIGICLGIVATIFFGDMWIKNQVERKGVEGNTRKVWNGRLLIRKHHNKGIALNVGQRRQPIVALVSAIFTVLMFGLFVVSLGNKGNDLLRIGLALIVGGGFSNTYDRLKRKYVVDYVSFGVKWQPLRRVIFNISDFCIIIGALLTALGAAE